MLWERVIVRGFIRYGGKECTSYMGRRKCDIRTDVYTRESTTPGKMMLRQRFLVGESSAIGEKSL